MSGQKIWTLCLMLVLVALMAGSYFWLMRRPEDDAPEEIPSTAVNLIQRAEDEVAEIAFYYEGTRSYLTSFIDEVGRLQWAYSDAPNYTLNPHRVREKARPAWLLTAVDTAHENTAYLKLAAFGLEPPLLTVKTTFHDGSRQTLKLGSQTADRQHWFFMLDGDPAIYLITAVLAERLLFGAGDMLDMSLPFANVNEAEYIRIAERGLTPIVLALRGEDDPPSPLEGLITEVGGEQLIMREPIHGFAISNSRLMESVIHPITQLQFHELADLHPTDLYSFGLEPPALEFTFRTAHGEIHYMFGETFTLDGKDFIYVKTAGRPHVFIAEHAPVAAIFGLKAFDIAERFLALVSITDVESITIDAETFYKMVMNHVPNTFDIEPTVNGLYVDDSAFRTAFRHIISLLADAKVEPFSPQTAPKFTITHHRIENPDTQLRFYHYNANFLAVSIDGGEARFATNRLAIERLFEFLEGFL